MEKDYKNKMINQASNKNEPLDEEFHFGGDMKYLPMVVKAKTIEEAQAIWEKTRMLVGAESKAIN